MMSGQDWRAELLAELEGVIDDPDRAIDRFMATRAVVNPGGLVHTLGAGYVASKVIQAARRRQALVVAGQPCSPECDGAWRIDADGRPVAKCEHRAAA